MTPPTEKRLRAAQVAHALAAAVRAGQVHPADALRILRHELRRRNTKGALKAPGRSLGAQQAIDRHAPGPVPPNGSPDSLHCDHVWPLSAGALEEVATLEGWTAELARLSAVVCVTAAENYALEKLEKSGVTGPAKYAEAGIAFVDGKVPW